MQVFVAMSGGVDSSLAAALLKKQGHEVVGVFIRVWEPPAPFNNICTWREERREAMRVAAKLDIPLLTLDLTKEYKRAVVDYMLAGYRAGRTPNPDVECNRAIKFGAFFDWALESGADYVATGHYARLQPPLDLPVDGRQGKSTTRPSGGFRLLRSKDENKDQTYFLWTLTQKQLARCLFPIGDYLKPDVRRLAKKFGLPTAEKKDSQGLCFIGQLDFKKFLQDYLKPTPGMVLDEKGKVIGRHQGAVLYTIGERHGFAVTKKTDAGPYYIVGKDVKQNILIASLTPPVIEPATKAAITLEQVNWLGGQPPSLVKTYSARIRHRGELTPCRLGRPAKLITVRPLKPLVAVAPGQSLVLYDGEECLGGGVIDRIK